METLLGNLFPRTLLSPTLLPCKETCSWNPCFETWGTVLGTLACEPVLANLAWKLVPGNIAWEPALPGNACLRTCSCEPCSCLEPCLEMVPGTLLGNRFREPHLQAVPKNLTLLRNLFLDTCLGASSWELAWEPLPGNPCLQTSSWQPCLRTSSQQPCLRSCSWEPCLGTFSWRPCLGTFSGNLTCEILWTCSWETCLGTCSWEPVAGNLAWEPVAGNLAWERAWEPYLWTCSWEPCMGTCSWEPVAGNLAWEPLPGNLACEPCVVRISLLRPAPRPLLWLKTPSLRCRGIIETFTMPPWEPWEPLLGNLGHFEGTLRESLQSNLGNLDGTFTI